MRQIYLSLLFVLSLLCLPAFARGRLQEYALILKDPPLARAGLHTSQSASRLQAIQAAQRTLTQELIRRKIPVRGSIRRLLNAVFVHVTPQQAASLRSLAGVQRVVRLQRFKRQLNTAVNLVNVTNAWSLLPGGMANAGAGLKIAILDSGIDQNHPAFQDDSLQAPAGYPLGDTAYTNQKVIVARNYEPLFVWPDDPAPRDRSGHGTALAMIAAGETNAGPLATITGVAPKAWLGSYKIFGSPGVNDTTTGDAVLTALEDAYMDGMDIVVLALGAPAVYGPLDTDPSCGGNGACDVEAQAVENAVSLGMTVVVSAGNEAQTSARPPALNSIDSPGTAPSAITVGASTNSHVFFASVSANGQTFDALPGDGPQLPGALTAPLQDVASLDSTGLACSPLPPQSLAGDVALIERGNCDFSTKINNAGEAGAQAVVIYLSDANSAIFSGLGAVNTAIPAMMVSNADGLALQSYLASNPDLKVTLDPALHLEPAYANLVTDFTSRGPSIDYSIKPEIMAVGQGIYTATETLDPSGDLYDASGYVSVDGTSFAAAMVAGAAALVKQANPDFTPAQIKSALVDTASTNPNDIADTSGSGEALITAVGGGKLNAAAALSPGATVEPATISFGWVGPGSPAGSATLTIVNTGSSVAAFNLGVTQNEADADNFVTVSPATVQLGPGQQTNVSVTLHGSFPYAGSFDGFISVNGPGRTLTVPYSYLISDGQPFDIMPVIDGNFSGVVNDQCWLISFKVVDQFGVAVPNVPVQFKYGEGAQSGASSCPSGVAPGPDTVTDNYGIASTNVDLGSATGDQVFEADAGGLSTYFYASVRQLPVINSISDSASGQVGQGLAPGSYISLYGNALSDATDFLGTTFLPFGMSAVSVSFWAPDGSSSLAGRLWYVSPSQINVQVPWALQGWSSADVYVSVDGIGSAPYNIPIASALPAMYLYNNLAIAQDLNYQLLTAANPARRGRTIILYANGLGPVTNPPDSGEITPGLSQTQFPASVTIGNVDAHVSFSGLTPGSIGLYQLNVDVPQNAPTGLQPLVITVNGVRSVAANLPIQ
jgi:minor extracellular serine protease Vpr